MSLFAEPHDRRAALSCSSVVSNAQPTQARTLRHAQGDLGRVHRPPRTSVPRQFVGEVVSQDPNYILVLLASRHWANDKRCGIGRGRRLWLLRLHLWLYCNRKRRSAAACSNPLGNRLGGAQVSQPSMVASTRRVCAHSSSHVRAIANEAAPWAHVPV